MKGARLATPGRIMNGDPMGGSGILILWDVRMNSWYGLTGDGVSLGISGIVILLRIRDDGPMGGSGMVSGMDG